MTMFSFTDCCAMLAVDPKTLRLWLQQANMLLQAHPTDARLKCLTAEQVWQLATLHARPLQPMASAGPTQATVPHERGESEDASLLPAPSQQETDLVEKVAHLETQVVTMQHQLTQLALELLQERTQHYEHRLQTLEMLIGSLQPQHVPSQALPSNEEQRLPADGKCPQRCLNPAELHVHTRVIPLIEYGARGTYVIICPQEGELHLTPDSPEWFEWFATLSSFRFVGQSGRFTAYRESKHRGPTRSWRAVRSVHNHNYKHHLGVTDHLTLAHLEQAAAKLQSYMTSL